MPLKSTKRLSSISCFNFTCEYLNFVIAKLFIADTRLDYITQSLIQTHNSLVAEIDGHQVRIGGAVFHYVS